jgi:hypothetical protein
MLLFFFHKLYDARDVQNPSIDFRILWYDSVMRHDMELDILTELPPPSQTRPLLSPSDAYETIICTTRRIFLRFVLLTPNNSQQQHQSSESGVGGI